MDPINWLQEEQQGPAKRIWLGIWETISEDNNTAVNINTTTTTTTTNSSSTMINNSSTIENNNKNVKDNSDSGSNGSGGGGNGGTEKNQFNPTRRKGSTNDNKASTYNLNKHYGKLLGIHGGCPWRPPQFKYARGIIG
jgi:non-canonical poly(A) RNA polymerase PAPD5/7